jgi:hypothetical protein
MLPEQAHGESMGRSSESWHMRQIVSPSPNVGSSFISDIFALL